MTTKGDEVKEQVISALETPTLQDFLDAAIEDLRPCRVIHPDDKCVVLTEEEAVAIKDELMALYGYRGPTGPPITRHQTNRALRRLTPEPREQAEDADA